MYIVGLTGPIGHGKTTFANLLSSVEPSSVQLESSTLIAEVISAWLSGADEIPESQDIAGLNRWVGQLAPLVQKHLRTECTIEQLTFTDQHIQSEPELFAKLLQFADTLQQQPRLLATDITNENKEEFRPILQWLGGYLPARIDGSIWYREIVRRIGADSDQAILFIVSGLRYPADGEMIERAGGTVIKLYRPQLTEDDLADPTERQRHDIQSTVEVVNNGTLEDLFRVAEELYKDLVNGALKPVYKAVNTAVN